VQQGVPEERATSPREAPTTAELRVQPVLRIDGQGSRLNDEASELNRAGLADWRAGQRSRAIEQWQRAARLAPRDAAVQNNLGYALMTLGELEQAWPALRAAFSLDPGHPKTRANVQAFAHAWRARCPDNIGCRGRIAPSEAASSSARHVDSFAEQPFPPD
jgi:tetratricopeptide (TPR) repeat protein